MSVTNCSVNWIQTQVASIKDEVNKFTGIKIFFSSATVCFLYFKTSLKKKAAGVFSGLKVASCPLHKSQCSPRNRASASLLIVLLFPVAIMIFKSSKNQKLSERCKIPRARFSVLTPCRKVCVWEPQVRLLQQHAVTGGKSALRPVSVAAFEHAVPCPCSVHQDFPYVRNEVLFTFRKQETAFWLILVC